MGHQNLPFKGQSAARGPSSTPAYDYPRLATLRIEERYQSMMTAMRTVEPAVLDQRVNAAFPVRSGAPSESDRVRYVKHFYALLPALVPGTLAEFRHLKDSLVGLLQHKPFPSGESALTGVRVAPPFSGRDFSNLSVAGVSVPAWQLMCNGTTFSPEIDSPVYITALVNVMSADVLEHYSSYLNLDHRGTLSTGMAVLAAAAEFTVKHGFVAVCGFVGRHEVGLGAEQLSRLNLHPVFDNKRDVLVLIKT